MIYQRFLQYLLVSTIHIYMETAGSGNNIGVYVDAATARYAKPAAGFATTENRIIGRGLIINNGQVLS